ncbi:MAG: DUF695 domain-containing protein [Bacteroidota bacterium]
MTEKELSLLITEEDNWTVAEAEETDIPFLIRFRPDMQPFISSEKFNTRLSLTWKYEPDTDSGLPSDEDMEVMDQIEDELLESLEPELKAVLAFVFTGENQRKWTWYAQNETLAGSVMQKVMAEFPSVPLDLETEEDPQWIDYTEAVSGMGDSFSEYDEDDEDEEAK